MIAGAAVVRYFEKGQLVGSCQHYCCAARGASGSFSAYWPHTAYFCPACGELWGRAIYEYSFDYKPRSSDSWAIESRRCVACGDGQFLIGSLEDADLDLLTREFFALLENLDGT